MIKNEILSDEMLENVVGGGLSAALVSAVNKVFSSIIDAGRSVGTALRMLVSGKRC